MALLTSPASIAICLAAAGIGLVAAGAAWLMWQHQHWFPWLIVAAVQIRKVDLTGRVALHTGKGNVAAGPSEVIEQLVGGLPSPRLM